jgi:hypothetical protein
MWYPRTCVLLIPLYYSWLSSVWRAAHSALYSYVDTDSVETVERAFLSISLSREREASAELVLQPEKVEAHRSALGSPHTLPPRPACCCTWRRMIDHHARTGGRHLEHSSRALVYEHRTIRGIADDRR